MPIYEYICPQCDFQTEKMQRITDDPLTECESCGSNTLKRVPSLCGFHLKGTGWAAQGYDKSAPVHKGALSEGRMINSK